MAERKADHSCPNVPHLEPARRLADVPIDHASTISYEVAESSVAKIRMSKRDAVEQWQNLLHNSVPVGIIVELEVVISFKLDRVQHLEYACQIYRTYLGV